MRELKVKNQQGIDIEDKLVPKEDGGQREIEKIITY